MRRVPAQGKWFLQGSDDSSAKPEERPAFRVGFHYDFLLDTAEVTQASFRDLAGRDPVPADSKYGKGPDLPVYDVSWYDAALYCNARSRSLGLDTVYAYTRALREPGGGAYGLEGLAIHQERLGIRLPTESEWEFAAGGGGSTAFPWGNAPDSARAAAEAWYAGDAGDSAHPVARLGRNAWGFYDLAGNVMEWVDGWLGPNPRGPVSDYTGPTAQAGLERPVKGGAYAFGISGLRISSRSGPYPALSASTDPYLGFRCALGPIPRGSSVRDTAAPSPSPVAMEPAPAFFVAPGARAQLVFVDVSDGARYLASVDYWAGAPKARIYADAGQVFHPSISPDGGRVAYCTAMEGSDGPSLLYLRRLGRDAGPPVLLPVDKGYIPRWWVDSVARDTFLVYANSGVSDDSPRWPATSTYRILIQGLSASGPSELLSSAGAFHDGLSPDGKWLVTGYKRLLTRDLENGSTRTLFTGPANGKAAGDTSQVCNLSLDPSSGRRLLFLDFGYQRASGLLGKPYGLHEYAFLSSIGDTVLRWYRSPAGEAGWEDLEWSSRPAYAVAGASGEDGGRRNLYVLGLDDSSVVRLAAGAQLEQPALWLGPAPPGPSPRESGTDLDSLGRYGEPAKSTFQTELAYKFSLFWRSFPELEAVFLGSSVVSNAVDPARLSGFRGLNMGAAGAGLEVSWMALRDYLLPHCPHLRAVSLEVPVGWLARPGANLADSQDFQSSVGYAHDRRHGFWPPPVTSVFRDWAAAGALPDGWSGEGLGMFPTPCQGWGQATVDGADWDTASPGFARNMALLKQILDTLSGRRIYTLLTIYPQNPAYSETEWFGRYGPKRSHADDALSRIRALLRGNPYARLYDANLGGRHDYGDSEAANTNHLCADAAPKFTARIDSVLSGWSPVPADPPP